MPTSFSFYWLMPGSFFIAFVLSVLPMPLALAAWRPEWSAMTLIFWVIHSKDQMGILWALGVGIFMDVLEGTTLGTNALAFSLIAYLVLTMHHRIKMFPLFQQSFIIFMLVGINLMVTHLINNLTSMPVSGLSYLQPALISAILWPIVYSVMKRTVLKFK